MQKYFPVLAAIGMTIATTPALARTDPPLMHEDPTQACLSRPQRGQSMSDCINSLNFFMGEIHDMLTSGMPLTNGKRVLRTQAQYERCKAYALHIDSLDPAPVASIEYMALSLCLSDDDILFNPDLLSDKPKVRP